MRNIFITRGLPGSGKSTFLKEHGLDNFCLSTDNLRQTFSGLTISSVTGDLAINNDINAFVFSQLPKILKDRASRGETIVVDATHCSTTDFRLYKKIIQEHFYKGFCLDFSKIPLDECLKRNAQRPAFKFVPENHILKMHEKLTSSTIPEPFTKIDVFNPSDISFLKELIKPKPVNLDKPKEIIIIGDLQGCATDLKSNALFKKGNDPDNHYIFVGDICDRGPENHVALKWILDTFHNTPNSTFLFGNHEIHLMRWCLNKPSFSKEFTDRTQPQLESHKISKDKVFEWCNSLKDFIYFSRNNKEYLITHSGLPKFIPELGLISTADYSKGVGGYSYDVDSIYEKTECPIIQVHGHRNYFRKPIKAGTNIYNLEGQVEFGGFFRAISIDQNNVISEHDIPNSKYRNLKELKPMNNTKIPDWINKEDNSETFSPDELDQLKSSPLIREKINDSMPHISSFNFTRDAFFNSAWDDLNITARGLFVNNKTGEIVARSYNKFFNIDERPETQKGNLKYNLKFPVNCFVKENGYLGILGFDTTTQTPLFASKSSVDTDFAKLFKDIYDKNVPDKSKIDIHTFLNRGNASLVFEVIDPVNDPHMIDYDKPHIVLLDIIRRSKHFEKMPYEDLKKQAEIWGIPCKERGMQFKSWESMQGWLNVCNNKEYKHKNKNIEGYVLEDSSGFQTKLKLPYYSFWKRMRSLKDRVASIKDTKKPLKRTLNDQDEILFTGWCFDQNADTLKQPITQVRKLFQSDIENGYKLDPKSQVYKYIQDKSISI